MVASAFFLLVVARNGGPVVLVVPDETTPILSSVQLERSSQSMLWKLKEDDAAVTVMVTGGGLK